MLVKAGVGKSNAEGLDVNSTSFEVYHTRVAFFSVLLLANCEVSEKSAWISAMNSILPLATQNREKNGKQKSGVVTLH